MEQSGIESLETARADPSESEAGAEASAMPRVMGVARTVLVSAMLAIVFVDPSRPVHYAGWTYLVLAAYILYSLLVLATERLGLPFQPTLDRLAHWLDVAWFTLLIALSNGADSIFFSGLYFAMLTASLRWGFRSGILTTVVSAAAFTAIGLRGEIGDPAFEMNRFLLRPVWLLVLGFLMAYWGGAESDLRRRLAVLRRVASLNPRLGLEANLGALMIRLRDFFRAETAMVLRADDGRDEGTLYRLGRDDRAPDREALKLETARALPQVRGWRPVLFQGGSGSSSARESPQSHPGRGEETQILSEAGPSVLEIPAGRSWMSAPLTRGRLEMQVYVVEGSERFLRSHLDFFAEVLLQARRHFENILLADQVVAQAAREERRRIARDLHDGVIQPYLALQMGLKAARGRLDSEKGEVGSDLDQLLEMVGDGITQLRGYVGGLREQATGGAELVTAIRRFSEQLQHVAGIEVDLQRMQSDLSLRPETASELFLIAVEALSNVRRHTPASRAWISLVSEGARVRLTVENEHVRTPDPFEPASIIERAQAIGGRARVVLGERTALIVEVPV